MTSVESLTPLLMKALTLGSKNINKDYLGLLVKELLSPKLHLDVPSGYIVNQGDAAISRNTLVTGGLSTCTGIVLTSKTHNFVCHVDSLSDSKWIASCIERFIEIGGQITEVARYNCHGKGLNGFAEKASREALEQLGLFNLCQDFNNGITGMHTVGAKSAQVNGSRLFTVFGKLEKTNPLSELSNLRFKK